MQPDDIQEMLALIRQFRTSNEPFDILASENTSGTERQKDLDTIMPYVEEVPLGGKKALLAAIPWSWKPYAHASGRDHPGSAKLTLAPHLFFCSRTTCAKDPYPLSWSLCQQTGQFLPSTLDRLFVQASQE